MDERSVGIKILGLICWIRTKQLPKGDPQDLGQTFPRPVASFLAQAKLGARPGPRACSFSDTELMAAAQTLPGSEVVVPHCDKEAQQPLSRLAWRSLVGRRFPTQSRSIADARRRNIGPTEGKQKRNQQLCLMCFPKPLHNIAQFACLSGCASSEPPQWCICLCACLCVRVSAASARACLCVCVCVCHFSWFSRWFPHALHLVPA